MAAFTTVADRVGRACPLPAGSACISELIIAALTRSAGIPDPDPGCTISRQCVQLMHFTSPCTVAGDQRACGWECHTHGKHQIYDLVPLAACSLTVHCSLLTVYCSLHTTCCWLPTARCLLLSICCLLPNYWSRTPLLLLRTTTHY